MGTSTWMVLLTTAFRAVSGAMLFLLFVFLFRKSFESREGLVPQFRKMIPQGRNPLRIKIVNPPRSFATVVNQTGLLQDLQMLRYGRTRDRQPGGQLVDRVGMLGQHSEDGQARGVAEGGESVFYVSVHLR